MTFSETAVSIGFLCQITLPTRIDEAGYRRSLIGNIFTNAIDAIEHTISGTYQISLIIKHSLLLLTMSNIKNEFLN